MTMRSESRSCDEFQMAAMAVLDGEVTTVAGEEIHAHVAGCEVCGAALAGLTSLNAAMARVRFDEPGVDLWPAIRANVAPAPQRQAAGGTGYDRDRRTRHGDRWLAPGTTASRPSRAGRQLNGAARARRSGALAIRG
jgi:hypothetical protein